MSEYEQSIMIDASADEVFDFVSNLSNLPKYPPRAPRRKESSRMSPQSRIDHDGREHQQYFLNDENHQALGCPFAKLAQTKTSKIEGTEQAA